MKVYNLSQSKVQAYARSHLDTFAVHDCVGTNVRQDHLTILIDGNECVISAQDKTIRMHMKEAIALLDILDRHYDMVTEVVRTYSETHRGEY